MESRSNARWATAGAAVALLGAALHAHAATATAKALRGAGIDVVAIHQHMVGEQPRILFLHFWGVGKTEGLARGVKAALDTQKR